VAKSAGPAPGLLKAWHLLPWPGLHEGLGICDVPIPDWPSWPGFEGLLSPTGHVGRAGASRPVFCSVQLRGSCSRVPPSQGALRDSALWSESEFREDLQPHLFAAASNRLAHHSVEPCCRRTVALPGPPSVASARQLVGEPVGIGIPTPSESGPRGPPPAVSQREAVGHIQRPQSHCPGAPRPSQWTSAGSARDRAARNEPVLLGCVEHADQSPYSRTPAAERLRPPFVEPPCSQQLRIGICGIGSRLAPATLSPTGRSEGSRLEDSPAVLADALPP
jgi:hypothetical protein